jgi:hypothetical protein
VKRVNSLLLQMNRTIDDMLVYAHEIIALTVDSRQPFTENQLIPLIEKLRDLLYTIELQVKRIVSGEGGTGGIRWSKTNPFLLLWLEKTSYYLGEEIRGGGYLFFNGTFAPGYRVQITIDGVNLTYSLTDSAGIYSFEYGIPVNSSWLGTHSMQSTANTPNGTLHSNAIDIAISLIPTAVSLDPSGTLLSLREQLQAKAHVSTLFHRQPLTNAPCHFVLDGANIAFRTNQSGSFTQTWQASNLGLGTHSLQAVYEGELPYAPSSSQKVEVVVNIPTSVTLNLFQTRYYLGYFVVGDGVLLANGSEPLASKEITLSVDGIDVANITTDAKGDFAFSISTKNMTVGAHTLRAAFLHHESMWRYSQDEKGFSVYGLKKAPYPFWPFIPHWGGLSPPSTFPELFIGDFAYITWLLVLVVLFIAIRILQVNKRRKEFPSVSESEHLEPLVETTAPQSPLMPMSEDFALELARAQEAPSNPNARIVWYYHSLLSFLTRKRRVSLTSSMTHWEVARLLTALGFSFNQVEAATVLFERAFYSGTSLTESDAVRMSSALTNLVTTRQPEVTNAV